MTFLALLLLSGCSASVPSELQIWHDLCSTGDWVSSAEEAAAIFQADSSNADALAALMISAMLDDPSLELFELAKAAVAMDSAAPLAWTASAAVLLQRGPDWYNQAEDALSYSISLDPSIVMSLYLSGLLSEMEGDRGSASTMYSGAMELDPGFSPAAVQYARYLAASGRMEEALAVYETVSGTGPTARLALAERALLMDSLGLDDQADSLALMLTPDCSGVWLDVAVYHLQSEPAVSHAALEMLSAQSQDPDLLLEAASVYLDLGLHGMALILAEDLLDMSGDSAAVLPVLGEALFEAGELEEAEKVYLALLLIAPESPFTRNRLGWISEHAGSTGTAVNHYLAALELDPEDEFARDRLRVIAGDGYDPLLLSRSDNGFSLTCSADLSLDRGNRNLLEAGGSMLLSYRFNERGTSLDLGFGGRMVEWEATVGLGVDTLRTETGWADLTANYWIDDSFYIVANCEWDRQRFSSRPWQFNAYVAGGWQEWLTSWLWLSPELGGGMVSTRWTSDAVAEYTEEFTIYSSAGLFFEKPHTFIQRSEISGEVYFPPDRLEEFISSGRISLAFRTWEPLYVSFGYEVDYTRNPLIPTWEKYDTRFFTSLNFNLL